MNKTQGRIGIKKFLKKFSSGGFLTREQTPTVIKNFFQTMLIFFFLVFLKFEFFFHIFEQRRKSLQNVEVGTFFGK